MNQTDRVRPIFVLGCPRSGNTAATALFATSSNVATLGEFGGFYLAFHLIRNEYRRVPSPVKREYLRYLEDETIKFAIDYARSKSRSYFVDGTPWNIRVSVQLREVFPNAIFVLALRHYKGVIQSLARSYAEGWPWAGQTLLARAQLWAELYDNVVGLPTDRTIILNFDLLARYPEKTLQTFFSRLRTLGFAEALDVRTYSHSHATTSPRPTIVFPDTSRQIKFRSRPSFDSTEWTEATDVEVQPFVSRTNFLLESLYGEDYVDPSSLAGEN